MTEPLTEPGIPRLPAGFRFGASTASYQIEGAVTEGGGGASIWDTFCAEPGRIADGSGAGNHEGLALYDRLVDALLSYWWCRDLIAAQPR